MTELAVCAAMATDPALRPRIAVAAVRLALAVISEPIPGEDVSLAERGAMARRRSYALEVTANGQEFTTRAQWGLATWSHSPLPDLYAQGGADAIPDELIVQTLAALWGATGGG